MSVATSSARIPDGTAPGTPRAAGPTTQGLEQFSFASGGIAHPVYYAGASHAPPLLLMPEIAGFAPGFRMFAERLVAAGFQVFLPWLFGPFGKREPIRNGMRLCISREFAYLRAGVSSPITAWLRALTAHISQHSGGGDQVGVIGMCLTGAFAIPLIIDPRVVAAVAAQPSVPLWPSSQLNVTDAEIAAARARLNSGAAHLFALRCRPDRICPRAKLERLQREFPVGLESREYAEPNERNSLGQRPHAIFTREHRLAPHAPAEHYAQRAFADLVEFFNQHLKAC